MFDWRVQREKSLQWFKNKTIHLQKDLDVVCSCMLITAIEFTNIWASMPPLHRMYPFGCTKVIMSLKSTTSRQ